MIELFYHWHLGGKQCPWQCPSLAGLVELYQEWGGSGKGGWCLPELTGGLRITSLRTCWTAGVKPARSRLTARPALRAWHRWAPTTARGRDLHSLMAPWGNKGTLHGTSVIPKIQSRDTGTQQHNKALQNTALFLVAASFLFQLVKGVSLSKLHGLSATPHPELSWDEGAVVHLTSQGPT